MNYEQYPLIVAVRAQGVTNETYTAKTQVVGMRESISNKLIDHARGGVLAFLEHHVGFKRDIANILGHYFNTEFAEFIGDYNFINHFEDRVTRNVIKGAQSKRLVSAIAENRFNEKPGHIRFLPREFSGPSFFKDQQIIYGTAQVLRQYILDHTEWDDDGWLFREGTDYLARMHNSES